MPEALTSTFVALSLLAAVLSPPTQAQTHFIPGQVLYAPKAAQDPRAPFVRLAVNRFALPNDNEPIVALTIDAFVRAFGPNNFEARVLDNVDVAVTGYDLALGSAGTYMRSRTTGARDLATVVSNSRPNPNRAEGSLFVAMAEHVPAGFEAMKGLRVAASGPEAFAGNATAMGEIALHGYDPDKFFASVTYTERSMDGVLEALRTGQADIGILRTCFLEDIQSRGAAVQNIVPVAVKSSGENNCLSSTELYPNWTLFATPKATPEVARRAAAALLSMPEGPNGLHWSIASDFTHVDRLYRDIRRGPYEYLRTWSLHRFWQTYRSEILLIWLLVLGLIAHALRSDYLVKVRTEQLEKANLQRREADERANKALIRIEKMQKAGVIGQMSSIVAHELRQPLSSIVAFSQGLLRILDRDETINRDRLSQGIEKIRTQAQNADLIIQKVRTYAKRGQSSRTTCDLGGIVDRAARTVDLSLKNSVSIQVSLPPEPAWIRADAFEIELLVINLIKNAAEAQNTTDAGWVRVTVMKKRSILLKIEDNGLKISAQSLKNLQTPLSSTKIEGMGLGLAIVRMIAESHAAHIQFMAGEPRGLVVVVEFPCVDPCRNHTKSGNAAATG